jgi:hypothetical protein
MSDDLRAHGLGIQPPDQIRLDPDDSWDPAYLRTRVAHYRSLAQGYEQVLWRMGACCRFHKWERRLLGWWDRLRGSG